MNEFHFTNNKVEQAKLALTSSGPQSLVPSNTTPILLCKITLPTTLINSLSLSLFLRHATIKKEKIITKKPIPLQKLSYLQLIRTQNDFQSKAFLISFHQPNIYTYIYI